MEHAPCLAAFDCVPCARCAPSEGDCFSSACDQEAPPAAVSSDGHGDPECSDAPWHDGTHMAKVEAKSCVG
jgi:hypothetical protein